MFESETDPAKALYVWLQRARSEHNANPQICYRKTLAAVIAHVESRPVMKLYEREEDIFEWGEGWEVLE